MAKLNANYLTYPVDYMRITQSYNGTTSHKPHNAGSPKDYPIDEGGKDGGQSKFYCPCDEVKIVRIYGVGNKGVNTVWIQSTSPVKFACGVTDYMSMQITHMNDASLKSLKVGQKFKRGEFMFYEGSDGATGNHFHISVGRGTITNNGWTCNSKGKYVLTTTNGTYIPENAFWIDKKFTTIISSAGINFKNLPNTAYSTTTSSSTTSKSVNKCVTYIITTDSLNVRKGAGTQYEIVRSLKKGQEVTVLSISNGWGKISSGYISMQYARIYSTYTIDALRYRKGPGTLYSTLGTYPKDTAINILEVKGNWGKTDKGWVSLSYVKTT